MCTPDADEPYTQFLEAFKQFSVDVHDELVYSKGINEKYIKIYESNAMVTMWVYYQRSTLNILKILINNRSDVDQYQQDVVKIFGEDDAVVQRLLSLDSVAELEKHMGNVREIIHQEQMLAKLKFGDLTTDTGSHT